MNLTSAASRQLFCAALNGCPPRIRLGNYLAFIQPVSIRLWLRMSEHPTTTESQRRGPGDPIEGVDPLTRFFNKITRCRRVATRYDKLAALLRLLTHGVQAHIVPPRAIKSLMSLARESSGLT